MLFSWQGLLLFSKKCKLLLLMGKVSLGNRILKIGNSENLENAKISVTFRFRGNGIHVLEHFWTNTIRSLSKQNHWFWRKYYKIHDFRLMNRQEKCDFIGFQSCFLKILGWWSAKIKVWKLMSITFALELRPLSVAGTEQNSHNLCSDYNLSLLEWNISDFHKVTKSNCHC